VSDYRNSHHYEILHNVICMLYVAFSNLFHPFTICCNEKQDLSEETGSILTHVASNHSCHWLMPIPSHLFKSAASVSVCYDRTVLGVTFTLLPCFKHSVRAHYVPSATVPVVAHLHRLVGLRIVRTSRGLVELDLSSLRVGASPYPYRPWIPPLGPVSRRHHTRMRGSTTTLAPSVWPCHSLLLSLWVGETVHRRRKRAAAHGLRLP
jgi:hypothetical protein